MTLRILVVGAGISGLSAARALRLAGYRPDVVEELPAELPSTHAASLDEVEITEAAALPEVVEVEPLPEPEPVAEVVAEEPAQPEPEPVPEPVLQAEAEPEPEPGLPERLAGAHDLVREGANLQRLRFLVHHPERGDGRAHQGRGGLRDRLEDVVHVQ